MSDIDDAKYFLSEFPAYQMQTALESIAHSYNAIQFFLDLIGKKVGCIHEIPCSLSLTKGKEYTIIDAKDGYYKIADDFGLEGWFAHAYFTVPYKTK